MTYVKSYPHIPLAIYYKLVYTITMRKKIITITLSPEVLEKAKSQASIKKWSVSVLIEEALLKFFGKN